MKVGDKIHTQKLGNCVIIAIHDFGTIDVKDTNNKFWRITGLPLN